MCGSRLETRKQLISTRQGLGGSAPSYVASATGKGVLRMHRISEITDETRRAPNKDRSLVFQHCIVAQWGAETLITGPCKPVLWQWMVHAGLSGRGGALLVSGAENRRANTEFALTVGAKSQWHLRLVRSNGKPWRTVKSALKCLKNAYAAGMR